jgi:hypothetical protein
MPLILLIAGCEQRAAEAQAGERTVVGMGK